MGKGLEDCYFCRSFIYRPFLLSLGNLDLAYVSGCPFYAGFRGVPKIFEHIRTYVYSYNGQKYYFISGLCKPLFYVGLRCSN